jgi:hypothetical protein
MKYWRTQMFENQRWSVDNKDLKNFRCMTRLKRGRWNFWLTIFPKKVHFWFGTGKRFFYIWCDSVNSGSSSSI